MIDDETENNDDATVSEGAANGTATSNKAGWFYLFVVVVVLGLLAYRLYPADHADATSANFIDAIFANNLVIFIARVMLFLGACVLAAGMVFIVLSIWKRAKAGHYLTRFGPFETQAIEDLRGEVETWQNYWAEENEQVGELRKRLEESDAVLQQVLGELGEATEELGRLRGQAHS